MIDVLLADFSYETKVYNHTIERQQERYKRIKDIENKIVAFLIEIYHLQPAACYSQRHPHYKTPNKELVFLKMQLGKEFKMIYTLMHFDTPLIVFSAERQAEANIKIIRERLEKMGFNGFAKLVIKTVFYILKMVILKL